MRNSLLANFDRNQLKISRICIHSRKNHQNSRRANFEKKGIVI